MTDPIWTFLAISAVVIVTPGQDTALTIRNTLVGGRSGGVMTALGVASGQAVWALATAIGVVAVLVKSEPVFAAVKLAGAGYLIFLGAQSLHAALRPGRPGPGGAAAAGLSPAVAWRQGAVSNLGNPKMAVFFVSLLPQFVPPGGPAFAGLALLGAAFCAMTFVWLTGYALAVESAGGFLRRPAVRRTVAGLTGTVLIALGLRLAWADR